MADPDIKHFDLLKAKAAYAKGENVTELLRAQKMVSCNTPDIIEAAYDLQAGSYIEHVLSNRGGAESYSAELAQILDKHLSSSDTLLDIGTGELTTLSMVIANLEHKPKAVYAFDISWSRVYRGLTFASQELGPACKIIHPFIADINEIPLRDKSISVTTSSHALEPNGGSLKQLLVELFRVTRDKLVLFEPCYEIASEEGKKRMDRLGYIKNIEGIVEELGAELINKVKIENINNPLNPTACFVIKPPAKGGPPELSTESSPEFSVPGTDIPLKKIEEFYFSEQTGLCFPILKDIPILKSKCSILASSLAD